MNFISFRLNTEYGWIINTRNFLLLFRMYGEWKYVSLNRER